MGSNQEIFNVSGVAIKGYDVVAFFELGKALKGKKEWVHRWNQLEWHFSSQEHLELFKRNPERFLPEYGGYCAFGASEGYKASTKPTAFTISNGKLYFNFAYYVMKRWLEKKEKKIGLADSKWEETRGTVPISAHPIPIWWKYQFYKLAGKDLFG